MNTESEKVYATGYKGFSPGMVCAPEGNKKQYSENTIFEEKGGEICNKGTIHFCENPFDIWDYYPPVNNNGEENEFAEVEALAEVQKKEDKSSTKKIKIGAKLGIPGFCKVSFEYLQKICSFEKIQSGNYSQQSQSGDNSRQSSVGDDSSCIAKAAGCLIAALGKNSKAKGKISNWIVLAEYDEKGAVINIKSACINGKEIKEDVWYKLSDGKFIECE